MGKLDDCIRCAFGWEDVRIVVRLVQDVRHGSSNIAKGKASVDIEAKVNVLGQGCVGQI